MSDIVKGYYSLPRGLMDAPWATGPFSRFQAFAWLVENAAWKPTRYDVLGKVITVNRGQLCASIRAIAKDWGWEKMQVSRFLDRLQSETLISISCEHGRSLITLLEYDTYGSSTGDTPAREKPKTETPLLLPVVGDLDTKESGKTIRTPESIGRKDTESAFQIFYSAYPNKKARGRARAAFEKAIKKANLDKIMAGLQRYIDSKPTEINWAHPATWLNDERWDDGIDPAPAQPGLPLLGVIDGGKSARPELSEDDTGWKVAIEIFLEEHLWDTARRGPRPDQPGCQAPAFLIRQLCPQFDRTHNQVQAV